MIMLRRTLFVVLLLVLVACGGGKHIWVAQAVSGSVSIQPESAYVHGGKLWIRSIVVNNTGQPITVLRDAIVARLPNGQVVQRAAGMTSHEPYFIAPGGAHPVHIEFAYDWEGVPNAMIDYSPGITLNGQPVQVPPLAVSAAN